MFEFRIIVCADGMEIIDRSITTLYSALTPLQMADYMEVDAQLAVMEKMKKKMQKEVENNNQKRKLAKNPLYRLACFFGGIA